MDFENIQTVFITEDTVDRSTGFDYVIVGSFLLFQVK